MKCPIDETELQMTERQGVEIDYCPKCRGIWLDRGELDKIVERSSSQLSDEGRPSDHDYDPRRRRRRGFLGDLFDFD